MSNCNHIYFIFICFVLLFRSVEDEKAVGASYCENMEDLLKDSDFVMLAVNLTPETIGLISHRELSLMKPTATLVNISRGEDNAFPGFSRSRLESQKLVFFSFFSCPQGWLWIRML